MPTRVTSQGAKASRRLDFLVHSWCRMSRPHTPLSIRFVYICSMDDAFAQRFVTKWVDAWNAHDIEAILSHFLDDVIFSSPLALQIIGGSDGVIRGKEDLRTYWSEGLRRSPLLHFEIENLYVGVNTLVIHYRKHSGGLVNEVLTFDGPFVIEGHATYLVS